MSTNKALTCDGTCSQLETRLSEKEEALLEKDLVFEQVTRLVGRVRTKADTGKDDTLDLAKKVCCFMTMHNVQSQIKKSICF